MDGQEDEELYGQEYEELYGDLFDGQEYEELYGDLFDGQEYEELYGDLFEHLEDGRQVPKTSLLEMEERMTQITKHTEEMQMKMDALQKQNDSLQRDKDVLIRNISCLFKTAQMEIARKNKQINELREEISQLKVQEPHPKSLTPTEAPITIKPDELSRESNLKKTWNNGVQNNGCRETRHADTLIDMDRHNPYDLKAMKKDSRDKSTRQARLTDLNTNDKNHQVFKDTRRPRIVEVEHLSSEGTHTIQGKDSFKGHHENRKEGVNFSYEKLRECQSQEKYQPIMQHRKKDRVNYKEFRDYRTSRRMGRDAVRTSTRTATIRSMNESDVFSDDGRCSGPKKSGLKRKVTDVVYTQKLDSNNDPCSCKIQKSNSFIHNRTDEKRFSNADEPGTGRLLGKECKNDSREGKNI